MKADAVLQVRIDSNLKKEAEVLFERLGISLADAVRMFVPDKENCMHMGFSVSMQILQKFHWRKAHGQGP